MTLEQIAERYACKMHESVNHKYDDMDYGFHLAMVVGYAKRFIHLVPEPDRQTVLAACWAHDVIEDTRQTYNDVKKELGEDVAEIVYALTNEKGKTRKERANEKYYEGIHLTPNATFVKVCDRLANIDYSLHNNQSMAKVYQREQAQFSLFLETGILKEMFDEIDYLFNPRKRPITDITQH